VNSAHRETLEMPRMVETAQVCDHHSIVFYYNIIESLVLAIECDCNGYNPVCDASDGTCTCMAFYVTGDHCELCEANRGGEPDNFCYRKPL